MKIEYCVYDHLTLAEKFIEVSEMLLKYYKQDSHTDAANLYPEDRSYALFNSALKTILGNECNSWRIETGACVLTDYLGFDSKVDLEMFLENNLVGGGKNGQYLFWHPSYESFASRESNEESLLVVVEKFMLVSNNLINWGKHENF